MNLNQNWKGIFWKKEYRLTWAPFYDKLIGETQSYAILYFMNKPLKLLELEGRTPLNLFFGGIHWQSFLVCYHATTGLDSISKITFAFLLFLSLPVPLSSFALSCLLLSPLERKLKTYLYIISLKGWFLKKANNHI